MGKKSWLRSLLTTPVGRKSSRDPIVRWEWQMQGSPISKLQARREELLKSAPPARIPTLSPLAFTPHFFRPCRSAATGTPPHPPRLPEFSTGSQTALHAAVTPHAQLAWGVICLPAPYILSRVPQCRSVHCVLEPEAARAPVCSRLPFLLSVTLRLLHHRDGRRSCVLWRRHLNRLHGFTGSIFRLSFSNTRHNSVFVPPVPSDGARRSPDGGLPMQVQYGAEARAPGRVGCADSGT